MADTGQTGSLLSFALDVTKGAVSGKGLSLGSVVRSLGNQAFDEVVVDSQFSPELSVQPWAPGDGQPGTPSQPMAGILLDYVRPRVRLRKQGQVIQTFAPYGEPNGSWMPNAIGLGAGVASLTALLLGHRKTAMTLGLVSAGAFGLGFLTRPRS